jgi:hypothetical protein
MIGFGPFDGNGTLSFDEMNHDPDISAVFSEDWTAFVRIRIAQVRLTPPELKKLTGMASASEQSGNLAGR